MADVFEGQGASLSSPAIDAVAVTPSDANDLAQVTRAIYVGSEGDLAVTMFSGANVTFTAVVGVLPIRAKRVFSTGTTATGIVALW